MEQRLIGYKLKPVSITVMAVMFALLPLVVLVEAVIRVGASLETLRAVLGSRYFLQEWGLSWSAAAAVYIVSRWSFAYLLALSGYVITTRLAHLISHPQLETPLSVLITSIWLVTVSVVVGSSLRLPYLNPKLRWWTRPPRTPLCREVALRYQDTALPAVVLNLSRGGAFVKLKEHATAHHAFPDRLGVACELTMQLSPGTAWTDLAPPRLTLPAKVAWMATPGSPYHNGVGLQFTSLSCAQRRLLHHVLRHAPRTHPAV
jgi:hypothetical protein